MQSFNTKFGFERLVVDVQVDSSGAITVRDVEVEPTTPGNWVRVVWRLPKGFKFAATNPVSRPGDDFEDPGFESPDTDPEADPSEPFAEARRRRYAWTARKPGNQVWEDYQITLSTGGASPALRIINRS